MKVVKNKRPEAPDKPRAYTMQLKPSVISKVDALAKKNGVSRQKLAEAILDQVTSDKNFVLILK
jgi:hypothetical protein